MPYGVTSTGFNRKRLSQIRADILEKWRLRISPTIDVSETGIEAQAAGTFAEELDLAWQALEAAYAAKDPAQAQGQALDDALSLRGDYRIAPRESLVSATVNVNAGTYPAGSLVAHVSGDTTARFANDVELVAATTGSYTAVFRAEATGPTRANAGTLTVVVPSTGFNSVTNATDAALGDNGESDADFFARSEESMSLGASTTAAAIASAVRAISGVTFARVYVNDLDAADANGVPGHSFETVVDSSGSLDVAAVVDAILKNKAAGIRPYGTSSSTASDSEGNVYSVGYTTPTVVQPYMTVTPIVDESVYPGDSVIQTLLLDWGDKNLGVGNDVVRAKIFQLVMAQPGVYDVGVVLGATLGGQVASNFVVGVRGRADLDSAYVTVTHTAASGPA